MISLFTPRVKSFVLIMTRRNFIFSSHLKGQFNIMAKKLECPSCGKIAMTIKKGVSKMADGIQIKNISRWVCDNCGEELFDSKTMKEIRRQRTKKTVLA